MSSGSRGGRVSEKSSNPKTVSDQNSHNNAITEKNLKAPTADQIRLAQITDTSQDHALQKKIEQFIQITGADREEASIFLHDHGYELEAALNAMYEGNANPDTWHERTKKKKPKAKTEVENKENRRSGTSASGEGNRERSASRGGRGGGVSSRGGSNRGRRDAEGAGRGGGSRRGGRLANGGGPTSVGGRGRGGRSIRGGRGGGTGRGASPHYDSTFSRQSNNNHGGFDDPIETWDVTASSAKVDDNDQCPIEEWGDEWTGSLEKTSVFVHSAVEPTPPPASDLTAVDAAKLVSSYPQETASGQPQSYSAAATPVVVPPNLTNLQNQPQSGAMSASAMSGLAALLQKAAPQSILSSTAATNGNVTHLQQQQQQQHPGAAPSILSGISTNVGDVLKASNNSSQQQQALGSSVGYSSSGPSYGASSAAPSNYSQPQHNSIFSSSLQNNVSRSLTSNLSNSTGPMNSSGNVGSSTSASKQANILPPHSAQMQSRPKQSKPKPQPSSKIPLSAVEMPDDVMSAINLQMTGLQFGSEGFDFLKDPNKPASLNNDANFSASSNSYTSANAAGYPSSLVTGSGNSGSYNSVTVTTASHSYVNSSYQSGYSASTSSYQSQAANNYPNNSLGGPVSGLGQERPDHKSLSSVNKTNLPQSVKLTPEPIPYPPNQLQSSSNTSATASSNSQQSTDRKTPSQQLSSSNDPTPKTSTYLPIRGNTPQKKDLPNNSGLSSTSGGSGALGSLVGSGSNHYSSYSLPPKTSTTFPSPPSGPYTQTNVQNSYSSNSTDAGTTSGYSSNGSNAANTSVASSQPTSSSTYGSASYGQVSSTSSQQQYNSSSAQQSSVSSVQYQNNYNSSSHASLAKQITTPLKDSNQVNYSDSGNGNSNSGSNSNNSSSSTSVPSTLSNLQQAAVHHGQSQSQKSATASSASQAGNKSMGGVGLPPGVQQPHHNQQPSHVAQQHQVAPVAQQPVLVQQQQQHQFVSTNALQGTMPPFYQSLSQPIYSYEELQMLQSRMTHMPPQQGVPSTLPGSRDANSLSASAAAYSAAADSKYRTDQNSSPVQSAMNTQGGHAGPFIANAGTAAAAVHPTMYMYHQNVAVPNSYPQFPQAIIQLPPNTGSSSSQFQPTKLQYNAPTGAGPTYYDSQSGVDYKGGYGSTNQGQSKQGVASNTSSMTSSVDIPTYKNHLAKSYEKPPFHASTPPPYNMAGSAAGPYAQVFLPTMAQAHHQNPMMHHQLHQDGSNSGGQRGSSSGVQSKTAAKNSYQAPFWGS